MVERMMYVNLMGRIADLDRVIEKYVSRFDIQFEYATRELAEAEGLTQLSSVNPYQDALNKIEHIEKITKIPNVKKSKMSAEEAMRVLKETAENYESRYARIKELEKQKQALENFNRSLQPFISMRFDMAKLSGFNLILVTFGKMPVSNFRQLEAFLYDDPEILFVQADRTKDYIWGLYAAPVTMKEKVDSIFLSLHFERVHIENKFDGETLSGDPERVMRMMDERLSGVLAEISRLTAQNDEGGLDAPLLAEAAAKIREMYFISETHKYASKTFKDVFVFVGWMAERDAIVLQREIASDDMVMFVNDSDKVLTTSSPPTKLKNPPVIRYFEFFTAMYGLPSYGEFDPTPFVAVTYTILFGLMFGDLGQGAIIALLGFYLYKRKDMQLGAIMTIIGVSSMFFGLLYGSVFGFESFEPLWYHPAGDINSTLLFAIGVGIFLILSVMALNIINAVRQKNWGKLIFSPNGIAGLVFYSAVIGIVLSVIYNLHSLAVALVILFVVLPLVLIALREPLTKLIQGKKIGLQGGVGMFALETIIELFEVLLTYFTNTVSFVRVGAFALSHAGMMSVVMLLSRSAPEERHNLIVIILGNIIVMLLEGLVVGIQVLRLEFYEMFSRFFAGEGRAFHSYRKTK
ncbi:MAG: ATPase [Clostridiales bacterium]|jgi:V/A-type H+-transporting ATPase subunit I|nr:ATPase [Clostridiales bacterium]